MADAGAIQPPTEKTRATPRKQPPLPDALHEASGNNALVSRQGEDVTFKSNNISLDEALRLYQVVQQLKPAHSAEVGLCQGISTMAILQSLEDNQSGTHHVMDPFQSKWWHNTGLQNIRKAGLESRLRFHEKFVEEAATHLPAIQFGFIDGSHLFDLTIVDFVLLDKKLEPGGVIGFHDLWMPALRKIIRFILKNRDYRPYVPDGALVGSASRLRMKRSLASIYRALFGHEMLGRVFSQEIVAPFWTLGVEGNMTFLQKVSDDQREYKFYREF